MSGFLEFKSYISQHFEMKDLLHSSISWDLKFFQVMIAILNQAKYASDRLSRAGWTNMLCQL